MAAASLVWRVEVGEEGRSSSRGAGKKNKACTTFEKHTAKTRKGDGAIGIVDGTKREGGNKARQNPGNK
jgi:hypothetical protein